MTASAEQRARDMLDRMGVPDAQSYTSGDLVELANLIADRSRQAAALRAVLDLHRPVVVEGRNGDGDEREGVGCGSCLLEDYPCPTAKELAGQPGAALDGRPNSPDLAETTETS